MLARLEVVHVMSYMLFITRYEQSFYSSTARQNNPRRSALWVIALDVPMIGATNNP